MKKFLVVCAAAMLCCSLAFAQEAEDTGRGAELSIIPRLDAGILYERESKAFMPLLGNTSLYTLFEGNFSDSWSFSLCNHWLASDWGYGNFSDDLWGPIKGLYHLNIPGKAVNANNFVDWLYVTYAPGDFELTLGKQVLLMGGFEFDDYDVDVDNMLASDFWSSYTCYQWGFTAAWNIPKGIGKVSVQAALSPWNRGLSLGLGWDGTYGPYSMKWSVLSQPSLHANAKFDMLVSLGNRLTFGGFSATIDYFNACGDLNYLQDDFEVHYPSIAGHTLVGNFAYSIEDKVDFGLKAVWNHGDKNHPYGLTSEGLPFIPAAVESGDADYCNFAGFSNLTGGLWAHWYPLRNSTALRVQAQAGIRNYSIADGGGYIFATLGVTYNLNLKLW
ncbi:MAG: hypothetical protein IJ795_04805 [Bacteroidales bacterium]|nr:hypothetical protein [Bacteroidales bacterium]